MTHTVETLQEKLEHRARRQAEAEVKAALDALPYFESIAVTRDGPTVTVQSYELLRLLSRAMIEHRSSENLATLTKELLDSVDRVNELASGLDRC